VDLFVTPATDSNEVFRQFRTQTNIGAVMDLEVCAAAATITSLGLVSCNRGLPQVGGKVIFIGLEP
jgi:hypothetical protein